MEPFAYAIQAPIGSVVPLFHRRKDAEAYIAKLTDSRDEAKIIPLYRSPLYALSGNAENVDWNDIAMAGRAHADNLVGEPGITKLMHHMADEIDRLREAIRCFAEQDSASTDAVDVAVKGWLADPGATRRRAPAQNKHKTKETSDEQ